MLEIIYVRREPPTDEEILSFDEMISSPGQTKWDYEETKEELGKSPDEVIKFFREKVLAQERNHGFWARMDRQIVGFAGINVFKEPHRSHCAELGFGIRKDYQRRGIGYQLVRTAIDKARELNLNRLEADCFADNVATIALLRKAGFNEEGMRVGAVRKKGSLRDVRLFGLLFQRPWGF